MGMGSRRGYGLNVRESQKELYKKKIAWRVDFSQDMIHILEPTNPLACNLSPGSFTAPNRSM
jgi:hypothetical protein